MENVKQSPKKSKKKKSALPVIVVIILMIAGLGVLFYPDFAHWWNSRIHWGFIHEFNESVAEMCEEEIAEHFRRAEEYNAALNGTNIVDPFEQGSGSVLPPAYYLEVLNVNGIMGRIEIPIIEVDLPIRHTVSYEVLNRGVGHIEGTSFPIGGQGTHAVLTAHTGMRNQRMFNGLILLEYGDLFFITVLDRKIAYEVDNILIVLPHEIETLRISQEADYVTLVTCYPYGINSHRLLVRGARTDYIPGMEEDIETILREIDWRLVIIIAFAVLFSLLFLIMAIRKKKKKRLNQEKQKKLAEHEELGE